MEKTQIYVWRNSVFGIPRQSFGAWNTCSYIWHGPRENHNSLVQSALLHLTLFPQLRSKLLQILHKLLPSRYMGSLPKRTGSLSLAISPNIWSRRLEWCMRTMFDLSSVLTLILCWKGRTSSEMHQKMGRCQTVLPRTSLSITECSHLCEANVCKTKTPRFFWKRIRKHAEDIGLWAQTQTDQCPQDRSCPKQVPWLKVALSEPGLCWWQCYLKMKRASAILRGNSPAITVDTKTCWWFVFPPGTWCPWGTWTGALVLHVVAPAHVVPNLNQTRKNMANTSFVIFCLFPNGMLLARGRFHFAEELLELTVSSKICDPPFRWMVRVVFIFEKRFDRRQPM